MIKRIIEKIKSLRVVKRQHIGLNSVVARKCEKLKKQLMADVVEPTMNPNVYKVVFLPVKTDERNRYNIYDTETGEYILNECTSFLECLTEDIYLVQKYEHNAKWYVGLYDASVKEFLLLRHNITLRQHKGDRVLLQTDSEMIIFNLKTKTKERTIKIEWYENKSNDEKGLSQV